MNSLLLIPSDHSRNLGKAMVYRSLNYSGIYKSKIFFAPLTNPESPLPRLSTFESMCKNDPLAKGMISSFYTQLLTKSKSDKLTYVQKWEEDLGRKLDDAEWSEIWLTTKSSSPNVTAMEANYKVLTRWYLVPARMAKYTPNHSALCFRGCTDPGTHLHIWWTCPIAKSYWGKIFELASKMFQTPLTPDPFIALLNLKPDHLTFSQFKLFVQLSTAAKQTMAKAWKSPKLSLAETKNRMNSAMSHAKMSAIEGNQIPKFKKIWNPWIKTHLPPNFNDSVLQPW